MSEEQTSFKVTDRRLFNPDGSPRELAAEEQQAASQNVKGSGAAAESQLEVSAAVEVPVAGAAPTQSRSSGAEKEREDTEEFDAPDARDPASFVNFIMSIASNAASALGMMEHPVTHQREVDLELGKHWIDVLGMLQQKTRGNLTLQEQQILEGLLSDLRMQYVSLADSASPKGARAYTGRDIIGGK